MKKSTSNYLRQHEYAKTQGMSLDEMEAEETVKVDILNRRWLVKEWKKDQSDEGNKFIRENFR